MKVKISEYGLLVIYHEGKRWVSKETTLDFSDFRGIYLDIEEIEENENKK